MDPYDHDFAYDDEEAWNGPSKSELKRQSSALQDLGEELMHLPDEQLIALNLPDELLEAVRLGRSITAHGGLKRQRKYIGKLLRKQDMEPVQAALQALRNRTANATHEHHQLERWRDRLMAEGDAGINAYMAENPDADRQKLRQLVREIAREREQNQPPRAARLLFRYLRDCAVLTPDES